MRERAALTRYALIVEYDGTDLAGWQRQAGQTTVQAELEQALSKVADGDIVVHGAGRTDAGVHARGQVAHFDSPARRTATQFRRGANSLLPPDISIRWLNTVDDSFDARRSALERRYRYSLTVADTRPALERNRTWWLKRALSPGAMTAALSFLLGEQDFSAFRAASCQSKTPFRYLRAGRVVCRGDSWWIELAANAFLHHMVRNIVGMLVEVGSGEARPDWSAELLEGRDRRAGAMTAPACGLSLEQVIYPDEFKLPRGIRYDPPFGATGPRL